MDKLLPYKRRVSRALGIAEKSDEVEKVIQNYRNIIDDYLLLLYSKYYLNIDFVKGQKISYDLIITRINDKYSLKLSSSIILENSEHQQLNRSIIELIDLKEFNEKGVDSLNNELTWISFDEIASENPELISKKKELFNKYNGNEQDLFVLLRQKYPKKKFENIDIYRGKLVSLFKEFRPSKLNQVDSLLIYYEGKEEGFINSLLLKFQAEKELEAKKLQLEAESKQKVELEEERQKAELQAKAEADKSGQELEAKKLQLELESKRKAELEEERQKAEIQAKAEADNAEQELEAKRLQLEAESKRKAELELERQKAELQAKAEADKAKQELEAKKLQLEAESKRKVELEEERQKAELQAKAEADKERQELEDKKLQLEEESKRKTELEEERQKTELQAKAEADKAEQELEAKKLQLEAESKRKAELEVERQKAEFQAKAEADKAEQELEAKKLQLEAENKRKAELEEERQKAEIQAKAEADKAEQELEAKKLQLEAESKRKVELEEERQKAELQEKSEADKAEQELEAKKLQLEAESKRKAELEEERQKAELQAKAEADKAEQELEAKKLEAKKSELEDDKIKAVQGEIKNPEKPNTLESKNFKIEIWKGIKLPVIIAKSVKEANAIANSFVSELPFYNGKKIFKWNDKLYALKPEENLANLKSSKSKKQLSKTNKIIILSFLFLCTSGVLFYLFKDSIIPSQTASVLHTKIEEKSEIKVLDIDTISTDQQIDDLNNKEINDDLDSTTNSINIEPIKNLKSLVEDNNDVIISETIDEIKQPKTNAPISKTLKFHLIAGSFSEENNAIGLLQVLKNQGYDAIYLGEIGGLYKVSYQSFSIRSKAEQIRGIMIEDGIDTWIQDYEI